MYQLVVFSHETVFRLRALTPATSPAPWQIALGYGLLLPLAVVGGFLLLRAGARSSDRSTDTLPTVWAVVGMAVVYLPVPFQRKLVMGLHLAVALLAGIGLFHLAERFAARRPTVPVPRARTALVAIVILLTFPTNLLNLIRPISIAARADAWGNTTRPLYWWDSEFAALRWADRELDADAVLQSGLNSVLLIPPCTGNRVWAGHWGETPLFSSGTRPRGAEIREFFTQAASTPGRERFVRSRGITHLLFGPHERADAGANAPVVEAQLRSAPFLRAVHTAGVGRTATTLYAVIPPGPAR
jgi:hypothetical protein